MNSIDRYLNTVCWAMGGTLAEQQNVRDELRAHVGECIRDLELQGVATYDALRTALRDLGDPEVVGRRLRASTSRGARRAFAGSSGTVAVGRRDAHVPAGRLVAALAGSGMTGMIVTLAYLWPG